MNALSDCVLGEFVIIYYLSSGSDNLRKLSDNILLHMGTYLVQSIVLDPHKG
jgi:hypothetical protein